MKLSLTRLLPAITGTSCLLLLAACGGGAGAGDPDGNTGRSTSPPPPPPEFVVRGDLFSFDTGMIADADINAWVETPSFGYSYWLANGPLRSDGVGLFEAQVPESEISLFAVNKDFVQPCAVRTKVTQDVEVRIEMLPVLALNVINAPPPQLSTEPSITGTLFVTMGNVRQPIAGADLRAQDARNTGLASTRSDLGGGFYLCNLPANTYIDIRKIGYMPVLVGPIGGTESAVLEIELQRERYDPR
jgi:hypothetical protein